MENNKVLNNIRSTGVFWKVFLEVPDVFLKSEAAIRSFYKMGILKNIKKFEEKHLC